MKEAGSGTVRDMDLEKEGNDYYYEVELHISGTEKNYIVNAKTGEVVLANEHVCTFDHQESDDRYVKKEAYVEEKETQQAAEPQQEQQSQSQTTESSKPAQQSSSDKQDLISEEKAKDIVRAKIPGAEFIEFYLELDDGIYQYEGTAHLDGFEYEFEVNAASGIIINWDKERIEYDDHDDEWDD